MGNPVTGGVCNYQRGCGVMKYRNKKTGAVVDVSSKISGENWEKLEEEKTSSSSPTPTRKRAAKKKEQ